MLTVSLLGSPTLQLENQTLSHLVTGRAAALLIYLAVTRQPQSRTLLADLLWENLPEHQAKTNLRYRLSDLRKVVGDYVIANGDTIAFNQELPHWVDVTTFTTYMTPGATPLAPPNEPSVLQDLLNLYTGEFLAGFQIEEAPVFERWMLSQRRHLQDMLVQGLQLRTQQHMADGEYAEGLALNHYLLTLEPWREEIHQQRMLLFAYSGQRSAALQQYVRCCQTLAEELDVPPMPQTTTLYEQIKSGQWFAANQKNGHNQKASVAVVSFPQPLSTAPVGATPVPVPQTTPHFDLGAMPDAAHFYGRQTEMTTLHNWVGRERSRLVALFGLSGQGKTALAATFVQDIIEEEPSPAYGFTQVIWRSLHGAPSCKEILQGWLQQLEAGQGNPLPLPFDQLITRLFAILTARRCLLVLDGVEELLTHSAGADDAGATDYRPGCEAYDALFRLFFQRRHRSCLLLTSQFRPTVLTHLDERNGAFHSLELEGLTVAAGSELLAAHGIVGPPALHQQLHQYYAGTPQWLSRTANLIYELFDGDGSAFLQEGLFFLGDIGSELGQMLAQLPLLEQQVLQRLAQAGSQPLCHQTLWRQLTPRPTKQDYFHALQRLQRAFLIQPLNTQIKLTPPLVAYLVEHMLISEPAYAFS